MASRQAIRNVIRDIFGAVPTSATHGKHAARNGMKELQQTQNGVYLKRYFLDSMDAAARKGIPEDYPIKYTSEIQQRRLDKLDQLRRRGKGPPKKGAGKRAQKK
mmetsp:Transcript_30412/g.71195  ORF Transcript_30412/g.71195 Transcript_30412/m.71195 type:complete len:104 (+) Transcript_30412:356-667(+)|eukprot:CAMPEP_0185812714 /NCGR_PEP_ID=MMETSP1322-20130828/9727_1 /TAXON_ID=265543 /ORGANISM="Minutocellus polymorphus, Strain RCC2270" /LENGTH=103 /DNA_ID=CAMNT_0028509281 /DNA_START=305 /DNA_END=616 /DNA_ORIENTATION=+